MSRIDDLIAAHCPVGVPFAALAEVASYATGKQLNRELLTDDGRYPVWNGGTAPSGRHDEFNTDPASIAISQGGASAGFVNYVNEPFWAGAHCYVVRPTVAEVDNRFLYYVLASRQEVFAAIETWRRNTVAFSQRPRCHSRAGATGCGSEGDRRVA